MATGTMRQASPPPPPAAALPGGERWDFIEDQIDRTRSQVKWTDIGASLLLLAAGVLVYFLAMALVDHWLFGLGSIGRTLAFVVLIGGIAAYGYLQLYPLVMQSINPVYVAHSIEQGQPDLKNSLINFLFLRADPHPVHQVVYDALEKRAADDLSHVPPETAVDRSRLVQVGYVLAGVVIVLALYMVISPKDPLRTIARVLAPWADISRPARVQLFDVQPGNASTYQGRNMTVSCTVRGLSGDDPVVLTYSTTDGQIVDSELTLQKTTDDYHYAIELPPSGLGLQNDVTYQLRAGDAEAGPYKITVLPALSFVVQKVEYNLPPYTGDSDRVTEREGDLHEIEGTRVTIHAVANHPIQNATVEFDPVFAAASSTDKEKSASKTKMQVVQMTVDPKDKLKAKVTFPLMLDSERKRPWHSSYQLRFSNDKGDRNENPVQYAIEVTPDLAPRVEILTPTHREIEVPLNAAQPIEVCAIDPDYKLTRVSIRGASRGKTIIDAKVFSQPAGHTGQQVPPAYAFKPAEMGLVVGDVVMVWAEAADNRTAPLTREPEPNIGASEKFTFRIVGPVDKPPQEGAGNPDMQGGQENKSPENRGGGEGPKDPNQRGGGMPPPNAANPNPNEAGGKPGEAGKPMPGTPNGMNPMPPNEAKPEGTNPKDPRNSGANNTGKPMPQETKPGETPMNPMETKPMPMRPEGAPGDKVEMPMLAEEKTGNSQPNKGNETQKGNGQGGGGEKGNNSKKQDNQAGKKPGEGAAGNEGGDPRNQKKPDGNSKKGPNGKQGTGAEGMDPSGAEAEGGAPGGQGTAAKGEAGKQEAEGTNPGEGQPGGGQPRGNPGEAKPQQKVKNDGSQDGDVIETVRRHLQEKGELPEPGKPNGNPQGGTPEGAPKPQDIGMQPMGQQPNGQNPIGQQPNGQKPMGQQPNGQNPMGAQPNGQNPMGAQPNGQNPMGQQPNGQNPMGAQPNGQNPMGQQPNGQNPGANAGQTPMANGMKPGGSEGMNPGGENPSGMQPGGMKPGEQEGMQPGGQSPGGQNPMGQKPMGGKPGDMPMGGGNDSQNPMASGMNPGGMPQGGADASKPMQGSPQGGMPMNGMGKNGEHGAGKEGDKKGGSPESQGEAGKQGGTKPKEGKGGDGKSEEGKSPSTSKKGSDSQGEGGDRSGGGESGGGQGAKKPGNDGAGSSSPGDQGNGVGEGQGKGETGKKGGDGQVAKGQTGHSGKQPGNGKTFQKGGNQKGPGESSQETRAGEKKPGEGKPTNEGDNDPSGKGEQALGGGGPNNELKMHEGDPTNRGKGNGREAETGDEANAEYAKKVTQMTLEKLRQQADKPDPELLKKLGADPNDKEFLRRFLDRWDKMYSDAAQPGEAGKQGQRELDEALKSLGLRPQGNKVRAGDKTDDEIRDRDVSASRPPTEYERLFRAYNRATRELKKTP